MQEEVFEIFGISFTWEGIGIAVAAIFSIITFIGDILQYWGNKKQNKQKNNIEYITDKRVDWIYAVRQEVSEFLALAKVCNNDIDEELLEKISQKIYIIQLYLNYDGIVDKILINVMSDIIEDIRNKRDTNEDINVFCLHMRIYLKVEWERVKAETNGKNYSKKQNLKELKSAYEKYNSSSSRVVKSIKDTVSLIEKELNKLSH